MCASSPHVVQIFRSEQFKANLPRRKKVQRVIETFGLVNHDSNAIRMNPLSASNSVLMGKYISSKTSNSTVLNFHTMFGYTMEYFSCRFDSPRALFMQPMFSINPSIRLTITAVNHINCCQPSQSFASLAMPSAMNSKKAF